MNSNSNNPNKKKYRNINAYILAGGKSARMRQDKAFLDINGKFFIDIIIEKLSNIFEDIYLVGKHYSHPLLKKSLPDIIKNKGPIGGVLTALTHSKSSINFLTGLDYPLLDSRIIKILLMASEEENFKYTAYVPRLDDGIHPLFAIYKTQSIDKVKGCIAQKRYQLRCILNGIDTKYINLVIKAMRYTDNLNEKDIKRCFFNLNTPEDYKRLFKIIGK